MFVINDTLGAYGGSHTLMYRMCKWLSQNGIKSTIICDSANNKEIVGKLEKLGTKIIPIDRQNFNQLTQVVKMISEDEEIKVVSFIWNYYLDMECVKDKLKISFDNIIYSIHPHTFKKGSGLPTSFLKKYAKKTYGPILKRMNDNNALVMMDEVNLEEAENYLNIGLGKQTEIIRLPMECCEKNDREHIIEQGFTSDIIMTAARAEFPYKGYMIGLVKDYKKLKEQRENLKLVIVSAGEDISKLNSAIEELDENVKESIETHAWLDYEKLLALMTRCKMFVGMGTTVLDAALCYKPAIAVKYDTYESIGDKLISQNPDYITADNDCQIKAEVLIKKVLDMNYDEYRNESIASFSMVKSVYDISVCMSKFVSMSNVNKECVLSKTEVIRHRLNNVFIKIRNRNLNNFDYDKLDMEE